MKCVHIILLGFSILTVKVAYPQVKVDSINITTLFYGPFNKTRVELHLYNPTNRDSIEGTIEFEINKTAFVENLWLDINNKLKKALTLSRFQGERIYNIITNKRIDPALLIKSGNGRYTLNVFPFLKHQKRKVILEYYSVIESDAFDLPVWFFDLITESKNVKGKLQLSSYQEKYVKLYRLDQNGLKEIIPAIESDKKGLIQNFVFETKKQNKIYFDFRNLRYTTIYNLDTLSFYQTREVFLDSLKSEPSKINVLRVSAYDVYPPDFILRLIQKITEKKKPYVLALGKDLFLNAFLRFLENEDNIFLDIDENFVTSNRLSNNIQDDYNWLFYNNKWYYLDNEFTLAQNVPMDIFKPLKIECPFLNKFIEYLSSRNSDMENQIKNGFLNSNLAKLVIEEDNRAIQIWERVTGKTYETGPTYFVAVEEMPKPIGGIDTIQSLIFYPKILVDEVFEFKIYILATINKMGNVIRLQPIKPPPDSIALSILVEKISQFAVCLPNWKPGIQRSRPVTVQVSIPLKFHSSSLSTTKEYKIGNKSFVVNVQDSTKIILIEKDFKESISEIVEYNSSSFFELMIESPDMIDVFYRAMYLSNYNGVAFKSTSLKQTHFFVIRKN